MHTLRKKKVLPSTFLGAQLVSRVWAPCTRYSTLQNVQHLAQGAEVHKVHKVQHLARGAAPCTRCSTLHEVQHLARGAAPCTRCSTLHEVQVQVPGNCIFFQLIKMEPNIPIIVLPGTILAF